MAKPAQFKQVFTSMTGLTEEVYDILKKAHYNALVRLRNYLINFCIYLPLYCSRKEGSFYKRTKQLIDVNLWKITKIYVKGGTVRGNIIVDPDYPLIHNEFNGQHTSPYFLRGKRLRLNENGTPFLATTNLKGEPYKKYHTRELNNKDFVNLINKGVKAQHSFLKRDTPAIPFWKDFLDYAINKQHYELLFKEECGKLGLNLSTGKYNPNQPLTTKLTKDNTVLTSYSSTRGSNIVKTDYFIEKTNTWLLQNEINFNSNHIQIGESADAIGDDVK